MVDLTDRTRVATVGLFATGSEAVYEIADGPLEFICRYTERADESGAPIRGRTFALRS